MPAVRPPMSTHRLSRNTIVKTYDDRGTVRLLANSAGQVTDSYEYDAFGNLLAKTGTTRNVHLYRGDRYSPSVKTREATMLYP
jgi:YD repeat-containing protein